MVNWKHIKDQGQLQEMQIASHEKPVMIFKHSTRCSISAMALDRLERKWENDKIEPYFLDLISHREISNQIAKDYGVAHESPQVLLIKEGKVIYHSSHMGIDTASINAASN